MMNKGIVALLACVVLANARIVAAANIDFDQGVDVKGIVESLQARVTPQGRAVKDGVANWTVMVYVNAKNNLERFGLSNINDMEKVGSTNKFKIAVELGRLGTYDTGDGGWKGERRYIIQKDKDTKHITSPVLQVQQALRGR